MASARISMAQIMKTARGEPFTRTALPDVILSELAGMPVALGLRQRMIALTVGALVVPIPLASLPIAGAMAGLLDPMPTFAGVGACLLIGLFAWGVWSTRETWPLPLTVSFVQMLVRRIAWAPGREIAICASHPGIGIGAGGGRTMWSVEGPLASGATMHLALIDRSRAQQISSQRVAGGRLVKYRVWSEADDVLRLQLDPSLPERIGMMGHSLLRKYGVRPEEATLSAGSFGWVRRIAASASETPEQVLVRAGTVLAAIQPGASLTADGAPGERPIEAGAYRPARWPYYLWAVLLVGYGGAMSLGVLGALAYVYLPRVGPLAALPVVAIEPAAVLIALGGTGASILTALVVAALFAREARGVRA